MERTEFYKHYANSDEERKKQKSVFNFSEDLGIYKEVKASLAFACSVNGVTTQATVFRSSETLGCSSWQPL